MNYDEENPQDFHDGAWPPNETEDDVVFQDFMWTLDNCPVEYLPKCGGEPPIEDPIVDQLVDEQQLPPYYGDNPHNDQAPRARRPPQQRSNPGRPPAGWAPDCHFKVQHNFIVLGVLCAREYRCRWDDCLYFTDRDSFHDCAIYQQTVFDHIKEHVDRSPAPSLCLWRGCAAELQTGRTCERNRIRHLTTHLPWYYLCPNCGQFRARPDAQKGSPCLKGGCKPPNHRIASRIAEAKQEYGNLTQIFTIEAFNSMIHAQ